MTASEIIIRLREALSVEVGRHLYGVLGTYEALDGFGRALQEAHDPLNNPFPAPVSVNQGILDALADAEFREWATREPIYPGATAKRVADAFEQFLRSQLTGNGLLVLEGLEMLFAYQIDLSAFRGLATDQNRVMLLLPGQRSGGRVSLYTQIPDSACTLPPTLIADNHLWELTGTSHHRDTESTEKSRGKAKGN